MKLDKTVKKTRASDNNSENPVPICEFSCEKFELHKTVVILDRIAEVLYSLQEFVEKNMGKVLISIKSFGFYYNRNVLSVSFCFFQKGVKKLIEAVLVDDGIHKRWIRQSK